jgi:TPR repeat protein
VTLSLVKAKTMLRQKRFQEAIALLEKILDEKFEDYAEAAYCLGIIHHTGSGVPKSVDEAANYYLMVEQSGHPMATYRLGGIYFRRGELQKAYNSFRSVAQKNPSGAYWAYRVLKANAQIDSDPAARREYLYSAVEQGHVVAQRDIAIEYISGKEEWQKIPYGLFLYAKAMVRIAQAVNAHEKMKYE